MPEIIEMMIAAPRIRINALSILRSTFGKDKSKDMVNLSLVLVFVHR